MSRCPPYIVGPSLGCHLDGDSMSNRFPHKHYLSAALALAYGGFAMTAGILSGEMRSVLDTYLYVVQATVIAVAGTSIYSLMRED